MTTAIGRSLRLYLVDGSPTGIMTAEIMNWTGHVLVGPRTRMADVLKREEADRTGVYFLIGEDPSQPYKPMVYVGEGDNVSDRIKSHAKLKDFWTQVCIVTSKDMNLTKAHVRYLEGRLIELTKAADRARLDNGTEPGLKLLPESDRADMEFFLEQLAVVMPMVGFDFLRPRPNMAGPVAETSAPAAQPIELTLVSQKHGVSASALELDGEVTVQPGSTALAKGEFAQNQYAPLRDQLLADGHLVPQGDGKLLRFTKAVTFRSPSAAAAVVLDRNSNGRVEWKLKKTGQTLKDWQDAQLATGPGPS